jgi:ribosome-associated heat shock protein Hsp15
MSEPAGEKQRIDKWLFFARVVKSRSLAQKMVEGGSITLNGSDCRSASQTIKPGDRLLIRFARTVRDIEMAKAGERRGPATEAQALFIDHTPPPPPRDTAPQGLVAEPGGRPEKADRRAYERLRAAIFDRD